MEAKIILLDEVFCTITGVQQTHLDVLYDKFGIYAKNYFFNPKYKLGSWDGKIRYFQRTGKTYITLIPDVVKFLKRYGYTLDYEDRRVSTFVTPSAVQNDLFSANVLDKRGNPYQLRPYQVEAVNICLEHGGGVIEAGTGAGKTSICAAIMKSYGDSGLRTMIIVPDTNLVAQTFRELENFKLDVGEYSGTIKDTNHQHIVTTWQSLKNNTSIMHNIGALLVDECHGVRGKILTEIVTNHGKHIPHKFGFTGTIPKDPSDAFTVKATIGNVLYRKPAHELIEEDYLASVSIEIIQLDENLQKQYENYLEQIENEPIKPLAYETFKTNYFSDFQAEKRYLSSNKDRLEYIANLIEKTRTQEKGNTLCLVNSVKMGKKLASMIPNAHYIARELDRNEREEIYSLYKENHDVVAITTFKLASTGLDIPRIFNMFLVDIGKAFERVIQSIGRAIRKADDKNEAKLYDITSVFKYSKRHLKTRKNYYKEAKYPFTTKTIMYENELEQNRLIEDVTC